MYVRQLKMAAFKQANLADLQEAVNAFTQGAALTDVESGTVAYAAGAVGNRRLLSAEYAFDGAAHVAVLYYLGA